LTHATRSLWAAPAMGESREELARRHETEEEELEERISGHLETIKVNAGKGKKAKAAVEAAEREVEQWRYDLGERHRDELEALDGGGQPEEANVDKETAASAEAPLPAPSQEEDEAARAQKKLEKARKKKAQRSQREEERKEQLEQERLQAGPSQRDAEMEALVRRLSSHKPPLKVLEVPGDGHCLYRAVADQIRRYRPDLHKWAKANGDAHEEIRSLCARSLRERREAYEPFAECADGEDYSGYCDRVDKSAEWGGHLEIRALADELSVQIRVHRSTEADPVIIGEGFRGTPLRVTFHQHYYVLGEHYNSAILANENL